MGGIEGLDQRWLFPGVSFRGWGCPTLAVWSPPAPRARGGREQGGEGDPAISLEGAQCLATRGPASLQCPRRGEGGERRLFGGNLPNRKTDCPSPPSPLGLLSPYCSGIRSFELKLYPFLSKQAAYGQLSLSNFSQSLISALDHCHLPVVSPLLPIFLILQLHFNSNGLPLCARL